MVIYNVRGVCVHKLFHLSTRGYGSVMARAMGTSRESTTTHRIMGGVVGPRAVVASPRRQFFFILFLNFLCY